MTTATAKNFTQPKVQTLILSNVLYAIAAFLLGANLRDSFATETSSNADAAHTWGM